ncbi:M23 family metallopeptidase [Mycolicibacterium sp. 018/SC-01/001]|uniref:M23 family metallopeptidase n=1 Tax=Mycolicibacterium sp. 018/SC-01/001 TaxID=2592069 RepID=UPI00117D5D88|nr:M23 family metallopeptidase [Mycolicibacterium sp. 018/SC-01/001]TRW82033.1 M23 family metallopeptidase [Mycolicibacterium sp. 018/SC-01/001]
MAQHRSPRFSEALAAPKATETASEVTDIIPFNEFGALGELHDLDTLTHDVFDRDTAVIHAPELDDLLDTDDLEPLRLVPAEFRAPSESRSGTSASRSSRAYRDSHTDRSDGTATTDVIDMRGRTGQHRKPEVPVKGRLMVAAMAVGATAAGAYSVTTATEKQPAETVLASDSTAMGDAGVVTGSAGGMQIVSVTPAANSAIHAEEITKAAAFAQERADREARLTRPQYVMPTRGVWTSGFGFRWGVLHAGIDIANAIGTPIYAAADGVVTDAGPTAGYGAWVKIKHSDGTVTLYGHVNTWLVSVGQRVMAGDQIATIGNRGNSTGPHLHFSVLANGTDFIDPVPWLAKRGLSPGSYVG